MWPNFIEQIKVMRKAWDQRPVELAKHEFESIFKEVAQVFSRF